MLILISISLIALTLTVKKGLRSSNIQAMEPQIILAILTGYLALSYAPSAGEIWIIHPKSP